MSEREFLEWVERELRDHASSLTHAYRLTGGKTACSSLSCARCRLEALADEAADRAWRAGV